jgi:predicted O-linked N-acetylglucosamine transferase (SPINDLY family)
MAAGRAGWSLLANIGLAECAAHSEDEYAAICEALAADLPKLAKLRQTLRRRMISSPLMDAARFAGNLEAAYRKMWQRWCAK